MYKAESFSFTKIIRWKGYQSIASALRLRCDCREKNYDNQDKHREASNKDVSDGFLFPVCIDSNEERQIKIRSDRREGIKKKKKQPGFYCETKY